MSQLPLQDIAKSWDDLREDPFVHEYSHVFEREPPTVETPAEMMGENKVFAFLASQKIQFLMPDGRYIATPPHQAFLMSQMISSAPIYFLTREMFPVLLELQEKCRKAAEEHPSFTRRRMPSPWFWLSSPAGMRMSDTCTIDVRLEIDVETISKEMVELTSLKRDQIPDAYGFYVDDQKGLITYPMKNASFVREAMLMLIEEKVCRVDHERPNRGLFRDEKRKGIRSHHREVGIIRLRSYTSPQTDSRKEQSAIEWAHQWLVRGHVRNQFYPASHEHKLIWIDPYLKGPEEAPFKESVRALVR